MITLLRRNAMLGKAGMGYGEFRIPIKVPWREAQGASLHRRSRLEIPLCNAVEADLFKQGGTHASERGILLIGLDEIAQTRYGVVPKPAQRIPLYALLVAAQIDCHFHQARTELTALDHAAGYNILRW